MHAMMILAAATAVSIGAGWQKLPTGGYEYIIQIEPEAVDTLAAGEELTSQIPPEVRDVRSYRIRVGRGPLPRESGPLPLGPPPTSSKQTVSGDAAPSASDARGPNLAADPSGKDPRGAAPNELGPDGAESASRLAGYTEDQPGESTAAATGPSANASDSSGEESAPTAAALWPPLLGSLLALFASVGGNVFLGWTAVSMRGRYKALLAHQQLA